MAMIDHTAVGTMPLLPVKDEWARREWAARRKNGWLAGLGQEGFYAQDLNFDWWTGGSSGSSGSSDSTTFSFPGGYSVPSDSIPVVDSSGNATGVNWNSLIGKWTDITGRILTTQYGQPAPGTVITTANGQYIRQATGVPVPVANVGFGVNTTGGLSTGVMIAGVVGIMLVVMMSRR